jgi:hypothetical protein
MLTDNVKSQEVLEVTNLIASAVSIWFVNVWISKTMFIHHMI